MTLQWLQMAHNPHFQELYTCLTHLAQCPAWKSIFYYDKTESLWIGSSKNSNSKLFSNKQITWAKGKVYALGVWFSTLEGNAFCINFSEKIERIKSMLNSWSARRLTLLGKITIIKSLAVSQMFYPLSQRLVQNKASIPLQSQEKWLSEGHTRKFDC